MEEQNYDFGNLITVFDSEGNIIRDDFKEFEKMKEYYDKLLKEQGIDVNYT